MSNHDSTPPPSPSISDASAGIPSELWDDDAHTSSNPNADDTPTFLAPIAHIPETPVTIQSGEKKFTTFKTTLTQGSTYYGALFSGRWADCPQADGSYFVDVDPDYFAVILKYIRHGVLPKAVNDADGYLDREFYTGLNNAAGYLGIGGLYEWLDEKQYQKL